jgi:hypothetical protein
MCGQGVDHGGQGAGDKGDDGTGGGIAVDEAFGADGAAQKIDQRQVGGPATDLEPQKECTVGMKGHGHGGLPDAPAHGFAALQKPVLFQRTHDDGHGLCRQASNPCDVGLGEGTVLADKRQHKAFVLGAHARLIGAAQARIIGCHPVIRKVGCRCHFSGLPGSHHAFAQNDISEQLHFAGGHNRMRRADAWIKVCA